jgi:hypothetical protein
MKRILFAVLITERRGDINRAKPSTSSKHKEQTTRGQQTTINIMAGTFSILPCTSTLQETTSSMVTYCKWLQVQRLPQVLNISYWKLKGAQQNTLTFPFEWHERTKILTGFLSIASTCHTIMLMKSNCAAHSFEHMVNVW